MQENEINCSDDLNESIKSEIVDKAYLESRELSDSKVMLILGGILLILMTGAQISGYHSAALNEIPFALIFWSLPAILITVGAGNYMYTRLTMDLKVHSIARQVSNERAKKRSFCRAKLISRYGS